MADIRTFQQRPASPEWLGTFTHPEGAFGGLRESVGIDRTDGQEAEVWGVSVGRPMRIRLR